MSEVIESQEEREVREATEALAASKRKLALAEEARLQKAAADLAAHRVEQERQLREAQLVREATEKKWAEEKAKKEAAAKAEQAAQDAHKAALEAALAKEEETKRQREAHTARLAKIEAERFQAEQDAARIQRELQQASTPKVELAPPSITDGQHPLSRILFGTEPPKAQEELSAAENAALQDRLDAERAAQLPPVRVRTSPSVGQVYALQTAWQKALGDRPNYDQLLELLSFHADNVVTQKMLSMVEFFKQHPMSSAAQVATVQDALDAPVTEAHNEAK
jgi:seryl-tRNA synthetase